MIPVLKLKYKTFIKDFWKTFETNLSRNRCIQGVCIKGSISSKNVSAIIRFSRPHDVSLAALKSGLPSKNIEKGGDAGLGSCPFSFSRQLSSYRADVVISGKENRSPHWNPKKNKNLYSGDSFQTISRLKESKEVEELFVSVLYFSYIIVYAVSIYNYDFLANKRNRE